MTWNTLNFHLETGRNFQFQAKIFIYYYLRIIFRSFSVNDLQYCAMEPLQCELSHRLRCCFSLRVQILVSLQSVIKFKYTVVWWSVCCVIPEPHVSACTHSDGARNIFLHTWCGKVPLWSPVVQTTIIYFFKFLFYIKLQPIKRILLENIKLLLSKYIRKI